MFVAGNHSKITVNTRNVFIECTGTDFTKVSETDSTFILSDRTDFISGQGYMAELQSVDFVDGNILQKFRKLENCRCSVLGNGVFI